jgi:serine/threonine protein kinase
MPALEHSTRRALLHARHSTSTCAAQVADFGLAREKSQTFVSGVTSQRGTLPWTAPEIVRTPHAVTEKVDVFSFGVVMWELWTGKEPYEGVSYLQLMMQLADSEARPRPPVPGTPDWDAAGEGPPPPELAPGWGALMQRCWAEAPEERPAFKEITQQLRLMATALKAARGGKGGGGGARAPASAAGAAQ